MSKLLTERQRRDIKTQAEYELELSRRLCLRSLSHFTQTFWHIIEPGTPYIHGWHIDEICRHLEQVAEFKIQKIIFNMPPRHMKSILTAVMFPAWIWIEHPERSFIYGSHAQALATRDSIKTRTIINSDLYQSMFKPKWSLQDDYNQKMAFQNSEMGTRLSIGVNGKITGYGGDYLFIDDPVSALDANSQAVIEESIRWHDTVFSTRVNNPKAYAKVITMQRLTENDLTGHVLKKQDRYERLILPARFVPDNELQSKTSLGFKDPRTTKGELLWPERFDEVALQDLELDLGVDAEAQLQQDPKPSKGGLFPRDNWQYYDASPSPILETVQFWDCAQKPGISNDYSVCATWARTHNGYYLLDLWREKTDAPLLEAMALAKYNEFKPNDIVIEDKSAGSSLIQYLLRETTLPITPYNPGRNDKTVRATAATPTVRAGRCYLKRHAPWIKDFVNEHERFPKVSHDDQVDTTSMMVEHFSRRASVAPRIRSLA